MDSKVKAFTHVEHSASPRNQAVNVGAWADQVTLSLNVGSLPVPQSSRGNVASLVIPIDEQPRLQPVDRVENVVHTNTPHTGTLPRHEPLRQDSLKRREALAKGHEGSRRRQRWENDRLLNNPWAQPPLPSDWEVHPTYPKRTVPYYLAPLWETSILPRQENERKRREAAKRAEGQTGAQDKVPKDLKQTLKKAKAAKGLLQVLEEEVRKFIKTWEEKTSKEQHTSSEVDSEDEEIVFVGRNEHTNDTFSSPESSFYFVEDEIQTDRLIYGSMADDRGASFGRWLVHCIGAYYGLRTWSVTVGDPARREAYVGIKPTKCTTSVSVVATLPRPLWGMV